MGYTYLSDNIGRRVPPHPNMAAPVAASGVTLTDAATGGDHEQTVVGGATYALTVVPGDGSADYTFIAGIANITAAANIIWVCPAGQTILIQVPGAVTSLHYASLGAGGTAYLRRLDS